MVRHLGEKGLPWGLRQWLREEFAVLHQRLDHIDSALGIVSKQQESIMGQVDDALNELETNTKRIEGASDSAEATYKRLAQMIANLQTHSTDDATAARIRELSARLSMKAEALGAAVEASPKEAAQGGPAQSGPGA